MQQNPVKSWLALLLIAPIPGAWAAGTAAQTPAIAASAAAASAPASSQQGVVFPGQPFQPSPGPQAPATGGLTPVAIPAPAPVAAPAAATMPPLPGQAVAARPAAPGVPGTPLAQLPPMPPMPPVGAKGPVARTAADVYLSDNMPKDLPQTIEIFKGRLDQSQRAAAESVHPAPKPVSGSKTITQAPGEAPLTVRLSPGIPSSVVFTDSTGAPWPIEFVTPGDTSVVDVLVPVEGSSTLQMRPRAAYGYGAVSVTLKSNPVPITFILGSGQKEVDTRLDVRLSRRGPNATAPVIDGPSFTATDEAMLSVLDGVPPSGARASTSSHGDVRAWHYNGRLYVRTRLPVVSPAWMGSARSADGTHAYVLTPVASVIVSSDGSLQNVQIGE